MTVRFFPRAQRRVKVVAKWWRTNRPAAPTLFDDELEALIERLKSKPDFGTEYQIVDGEIVRRTLLPGARSMSTTSRTRRAATSSSTRFGAHGEEAGPKL